MGFLDNLTSLFGPRPGPLQTRAIDSFVDHPGITEQLLAVQGLTPRPWRPAGMKEALGVPAIFRAVSLISNTVGTLNLEGYRQGSKLDQPDSPRLIQRPNPFSTARDFFRDTAYSMATRGEAWWWIAARDLDGVALSLFPVNPGEVRVAVNERDLLRPEIRWRDRIMRNEDMVQITLQRELGSLRGHGPLQVCGAAMSVAVEAQEWAANYFAASGIPSIELHSLVELTETEASDLKAQWIETPANMPRVTTPSLELKEFGVDPQKAQLTEARDYQNGEVARMFGIPGSLLQFAQSGQSLTYTNNQEEWISFLRGCLAPNYLEPMEQAISDLLTRATVARFNVEGLLRADVKTRYEVHNIAITAGVYGPEEAQRQEGLAPGSVETAPVPLALPQSVPNSLPIQMRSMGEVRCSKCHKLYGELSAPYRFTCPRCKTLNQQADLQVRSEPDGLTVAVMALASREQPVPAPQSVTFAEGAIQYHAAPTTVEAPPPAQITVNMPEQPASVVNLPEGMVRVDVQPAEAPQVTVEAAQITVNVPEQPAPEVTVNLPEPHPITRRIERDKENNIVKIVEVPA